MERVERMKLILNAFKSVTEMQEEYDKMEIENRKNSLKIRGRIDKKRQKFSDRKKKRVKYFENI